MLGKVKDVRIHATGHSKVVWGDECDLHDGRYRLTKLQAVRFQPS
jgi:hypothetical protein